MDRHEQSKPLVVVIGAGPGVGGAVGRRFGAAGYDVALISRDSAPLEELGAALEADGITTGWSDLDITDAEALTAAIDRFAGHAGRIDALHFNPSAFRAADPLHLSPAELAQDVTLGVGALLTAVQAARPHMHAGGRITATGSLAADAPSASAASLGVQKAGLRNLVQSLDATLSPDGIRAVTVTVRGVLAYTDPTSQLHPDRVADTIFAAAHQSEDGWLTEVPHPASTLTAG